jgi:putative transposase
MIDKKTSELSVVKQCELTSMNRSTVYYEPKESKPRYDESLVQEIQNINEEISFYGHLKVREELKDRGFDVGIKTVRNIRKMLGIATFYPKPKTTFTKREDTKYPYVIRDLEIVRPNQVWAIDITYVPTLTGFAYKVAIIDIFSRKILSYRLSNTMHQRFCIEALTEALNDYPHPEIFNSDQGSQFTSNKFTRILLEKEITISMDGKGRALDNIYIERYWRSYKYENVFLKNYQNLFEAKLETEKYVTFYNSKRFHASLNYKTPDKIYYENLYKSKNYDKYLQMVA